MTTSLLPDSLLPGNLSDLERDLDVAIARMADIDIPLNKLWDPFNCPIEVLPWLAWALSVDDWSSDWSESIKRQVVANSLDLHRIKGTRPAIEHGLNSLSLNTDIQEWFETTPQGVPGTFNVDVFVDNQGITTQLIESIHRSVKSNKRGTAHYSLTMNLAADSNEYHGGVLQLTSEIEGQPYIPVLDDANNITYLGGILQLITEIEGQPYNAN